MRKGKSDKIYIRNLLHLFLFKVRLKTTVFFLDEIALNMDSLSIRAKVLSNKETIINKATERQTILLILLIV